jgi:endonuclease/exonuclease/phosphatase family metal-dependent hydrolase
MMLDYSLLSLAAVQDIARLRRRITASGLPGKQIDRNLIIATWNLRHFGDFYPEWTENPDSPKRNLRAMAIITEIVRRVDVLAIQEVKRELNCVMQLLDWLGPDWGMIVTDVTEGDPGNSERLAFVYDRRRVSPSGLAGEIVLPASVSGNPVIQFARSPYMVSFRCGLDNFVLLTAHIKYGDVPDDRLEEVQGLANYVATEIRDRASSTQIGENNLIVLGDFNIDARGDNPLFKAFVSTGLQVPHELENLKTTYGTEPKYYDQIAWFSGSMNLLLNNAGSIDFTGAVFQEMSLRSMSYRVSDHLPLWAEFKIDRSEEKMAVTLGLDPAMPDPLANVPN